MDFYLNDQNVINRLVDIWKDMKLIIAYDFDDTVFDFHKKGRNYNDVISLLKRCKKVGANFIVFTCRNDYQILEVKEYLDLYQIPYDKINENMDIIDFTESRKVFYNILLDDRAGLSSAYHCLLEAVKIIEKERGIK